MHNIFAFPGTDKTILLWDIASGDMVAQLKGHTDTIYTLDFSRDGTLLASGSLILGFLTYNIG